MKKIEKLKREMSHDCLKYALRLISEIEFYMIVDNGRFGGFRIREEEYEEFMKSDKDSELFISLFKSLGYVCYIYRDDGRNRLFILQDNK